MDRELTGSDERVLLESLLDSPDLKSFLARLTALCESRLSAALDSAVHCSVTVYRDLRGYTVVAGDDVAGNMDEIQYSGGQGPCLQALRTGTRVLTSDLLADTRWPGYAVAMCRTGIRSVLAQPVPLRQSASAVLNCYSPLLGAFEDRGLLDRVESLTRMASTSLMLAVRIGTEADQAADLRAVLESRTAINLATGVIMAQTGRSQKQALDLLRRASNHRNRKLREIAAEILARFGDTVPDTYFH